MKENEGIVRTKWSTVEGMESEKGEKDEAEGPGPSASALLARPLHLVDTPGHPRLRTRSLAQFLPTASGVVFVIDGVTGLTGKNVRDAGEHLHVLLSLLSLHAFNSSSTPLPLLILLSRSDFLSPLSASASKSKSLPLTLDRARQSLAREMERRRLASAASGASAGARLEGLEAIPANASAGLKQTVLAMLGMGTARVKIGNGVGLPSDEAEVLGNEAFAFEGPFAWEKLEGSVKWGYESVKGGEGGVDAVWDWVEEL